jgi:hypothetical protein
MKIPGLIALVFLWSVSTMAQVAAPTAPPPAAVAPAAGAPAPDPLLLQLTQLGQTTDADLSHLQVNRWKMDSSGKRQAQGNAEAVQRNLRDALPELILAAQSSPGSVAPQFKLYRNLNALYDVLANVTESAGAYGKKDEYQALAADTQRLDTVRRQLADRLEALTAQHDAELARIRLAQQQAAAAAAQPVKKIVIEDEAPPKKKKTPVRKKAVKPAATPR